MVKYFTNADIFIDCTQDIHGGVWVQRSNMTHLDSSEYWDAMKYHDIKKIWIPVRGDTMCYWVTGSILDTAKSQEEKIAIAKKVAIFYHKNRDKFKVVTL